MFQQILTKLKKKQITWDIAGVLAKYVPYVVFKRPPKQIIMEMTNACNLRCPACPTHTVMKRNRGYMDIDLFKSVIDEFKGLPYKPVIAMNFAGEPLLHQRIDELVAYAAENGHKTFISSNTTLLNKSLSERLIKAKLAEIHVCLEGMSKEAHESYRRGSNFEVVKKNIEDLMDARRELNSSLPHVTIQTLLTSYSENQMEEMVEWAKSIGADSINFKTMSQGSYTTDEAKEKFAFLLPEKKELRRKTTALKKTLCAWPLDNALVYWNGDLGLCCVDFDRLVEMKNIKDGGFLKAYYSGAATTKRKLGFRKKFGMCKNCSLGNADYLGYEIQLKEKSKK